MKRMMMFFGLLAMALGLLAQTAVPPALGDGTEANPYQIATWQNLYWLSQTQSAWDKHFIQTADIDFADAEPAIETWDDGAGWEPIGNDEYIFAGNYSGNHHTITGLYLNRTSTDYQGLFGVIESLDSEIKNLGLLDININGGNKTGGLAGYNNSTITNCYSIGNINGINSTGSLVGFHYDGEIKNCYSISNVNGELFTGGLVGYFQHGIIKNSYYNYETNLINNSHTITIGALTNDLFNTWILNKSLNISDYLTSDNSFYFINNVNDFKNLLAFGQYSEYQFRLTLNLDLMNEENFFIPYFSGTFNGNGYTIYNLTLNLQNTSFIAMFGYTKFANIHNLSLTNVNVNGKLYTGGLVGFHYHGNISNCYSTGNVSGESVGGLVETNYNGTISNCYSTGNVTGESAAGLVRTNDGGFIINCYSSANTSGAYLISGFLSANYYGTVSNCYSTGIVLGDEYTSGLVSWNFAGPINNSFWDIETSGQSTSDGGTGLTTAQMKTQSTYTDAGWSFPNPWSMNPEINQGYPYLNFPNSVPNDDVTIETPLLSKAVLQSAYPNPFNPSTTISFDLASPETVKIDIYNIKGQIVKQLVNKAYDKGDHSLVWDGKDNIGKACGTGIYFYRMTAGKTTQSKKMMLIK